MNGISTCYDFSGDLLKARLATSPLVELKTKKHSGVVNLLGQFTKTPTKKAINAKYNNAIKFFHKHFNGEDEPNYLKVRASTIKENLNILDRLHAETKSILDGIDLHSMEQGQIRITKPSE